MDPLTQGIFGALFAQSHGKSKHLAAAAIMGALAGMSPDLDVFIRSSQDPLLALQYHRHFTHSFLFIPIGGFLCSLVLHPFIGRRFGVTFLQSLAWCVLGYASHGLLDSLTSYGTQLFWPFTNSRVALDIISIVDPLVTIPLLVFICLSAFMRKRRYIICAMIWIAVYFSLSAYQHQCAIQQGKKLAEARGLKVVHIAAKPSFANIIIWKVIVTTEDAYYIDAIKVGVGQPVIWEGQHVKKLEYARDLPWLDMDSQQRKDIERFRWFSNGYIALDQDNPDRVVDIRYSLLPQEIKPLWGIKLSRTAAQDQHVQFDNSRNEGGEAAKKLWAMLLQ